MRRSDGEGRTLLRVNPTASRDPSVFTQPHCSVVDGERVQVLRVATSPGSGYVWVRTANGVEGYLNRHYVFPMVWNTTWTVHLIFDHRGQFSWYPYPTRIAFVLFDCHWLLA